MLLISGSEAGGRVRSTPRSSTPRPLPGSATSSTRVPRSADTSHLVLAPEHKATEELIAASGLPATILRNNWYHRELRRRASRPRREHGVLPTSAGDGRVASAARADYAEAAAVGADRGRPRRSGLRARRRRRVGLRRPWPPRSARCSVARSRVQQLSTDEHVALLEAVGLDAGTARLRRGIDAGIRRGRPRRQRRHPRPPARPADDAAGRRPARARLNRPAAGFNVCGGSRVVMA